MSNDKIRVLIVEDSTVAREMLIRILTSDPAIEIIGTAANGEEAIAALATRKPDVITMDVHMPGMDGFQATRQIMETQPVPIVIVTASFDADDVSKSFRAMEAGAVAIVEKPQGIGHPDFKQSTQRLVQTVKAMSEVRVVRRWNRTRQASHKPADFVPRAEAKGSPIRLIAIGASTGGPPVLRTILASLPKDLPVPILIVQHISSGFVQGLADWLGSSTGLPIEIASQGQRPQDGHVYIAPDNLHMGIDRGGRIALSDSKPESGLRPAVSHLFRSVVACYGASAIGVLLTGMGRDGAEELKLLRDKGAVTIAQDEQSSVVHGMPGEAIKLDAARFVMPPEKIGPALESLVLTSRTPA